jgi:hypothetical protein
MNKNTVLCIINLICVVVGGYFYSQNQKTPRTLPEEQQVVEESTITPIEESVANVSEIALTVTSPVNGTTVSSSQLTVKGKTLPKAEVYANEAEGVADAAGSFALSVALDEGENSIIVTAVDVDGNVAETEVTVTYSVGQ